VGSADFIGHSAGATCPSHVIHAPSAFFGVVIHIRGRALSGCLLPRVSLSAGRDGQHRHDLDRIPWKNSEMWMLLE
jgi:hypothetical protein